MSAQPAADAVVLVGGQGTRLRPLTLTTPKPMLPTAGVPFLEHLLSRISQAGITHVILGTSYRAEIFTEHFGDGSGFGLEIEYVVEEEPLGTGGAIRNVYERLRAEEVLIFNGDILSGVDLAGLQHTHRDNNADVTLHLVRVADPRPFGSVPTAADGRVQAFLEKTTKTPATDQINAGCYIFRRSVIARIPADRPVSVERETFPGLLKGGARVFGHVDSSYWLDLGTPAAFVQGSTDLVTGLAPTSALPKAATHDCEHLSLSGADIAYDAVLTGGVTVGARAVVGPGAQLNRSVIFDDAVIGSGARVDGSVVGRGARVGPGAVVVDAVIGDGAVVGAGCELLHGARVWPHVVLADNGIRFSAPN